MNTLYQGEDLKFEFTLTDDQYLPINLSTVNNIIVYIWENSTGTPKTQLKYSKTQITDYKPLITGYDDANGRFKLIIESSDTKLLPTGDIYAEIKVAIPDDEFSDNDMKTVASNILLGTVETALTVDE